MPYPPFFARNMKRSTLISVYAAPIILLFLYTGTSKFIDFHTFHREMMNQPFPTSWAPYISWILPSLEILIALALLLDRTRRVGFYFSLGLMSLFTLYTCLVLFHVFHYIPCSCGGVIKHLTWTQHLFFNLFFVGIAILGIRLGSGSVGEKQLERLDKRQPQ